MLPDAADVIHHHIVPTNTPGEQSYECSCSFKRSVPILYADVLGAENGRPDPSFSKPVSRYYLFFFGVERSDQNKNHIWQKNVLYTWLHIHVMKTSKEEWEKAEKWKEEMKMTI